MIVTDPRRPWMTEPQDDLRELQAALEERDSRLRLLSRPLSLIFCTIDRELRVTSAWGSAFEAVGVDPANFVGMDVYEIFETDDDESTPVRETRAVLRGETESWVVEWQGLPWQVRGEPMFDADGRVAGAAIVAVHLDATDPLLAELGELLQRSLELEHKLAEHPEFHAHTNGNGGTLTAGDITIDPAGLTAKRGDRTLELSPTEFRLLTEFVREQGRVLSRDHLLNKVWGYHFAGRSRLVDMAVKRLRDKLECPGGGGGPISTVRGIGYRLDA